LNSEILYLKNLPATFEAKLAKIVKAAAPKK